MKITGKAFWARVYEGNHDEYGGKEQYKITIAPNDEGWVKFNKSGLTLKPKPVGDDDELSVTFRRDVQPKKGVDKNGKAWSMGGGVPQVVDGDGDEFTKLIGNGSVVEVAIDVYTIKAGPMKGKKGHRLDGVKVLEHIAYEAPDEDDESDSDVPFEQEEPAKEEPKAGTKPAKKKLPF
jgi:hypothetical protein